LQVSSVSWQLCVTMCEKHSATASQRRRPTAVMQLNIDQQTPTDVRASMMTQCCFTSLSETTTVILTVTENVLLTVPHRKRKQLTSDRGSHASLKVPYYQDVEEVLLFKMFFSDCR